ncbi:MAG: DUF5009 domain-containing protein [Bacteroidia bacterium]|nr:DUF5009 domain-containing protein [Bacteroidia bacterium]
MKAATISAASSGTTSTANGSATLAPDRVASIDILRALTMVLMIFVNDLWSLKNIPAWLGHVERGVDGIGLADVVFPAFLFIVGLSLPFAIDARRRKGDNDWQIVQHVLVRTGLLLIMGVFLVNGETINAAATGLPRHIWNTLCCLCFILISNTFPVSVNRYVVMGVRAAGFITLLILAIVYRGGEDDSINYFGPQWWGILGLIGWAYLVSGLVTTFSRNNILYIFIGWAFFSVLSVLSHAKLLPDFLSFIPDAILGGTLTGLTMGGVLTSVIFQHFRKRQDNMRMTLGFLGMAAVWVLLFFVTRPYWGLAKLGATPAWLFLCSAFTILAFTAIYWVADVKGKANWFAFVKPAGTATLLCYLIPYFAYAFTRVLGIHLPEIMLSGGLGLLKSLSFALLCVGITAGLIRLGVRLKI